MQSAISPSTPKDAPRAWPIFDGKFLSADDDAANRHPRRTPPPPRPPVQHRFVVQKVGRGEHVEQDFQAHASYRPRPVQESGVQEQWHISRSPTAGLALETREDGTPPSVPSLSCGLPVYNGGTLLGEPLESILPQTTTNFESIMSDHVSTGRDTVDYLFEAFADHPKRGAHSTSCVDPQVRAHVCSS